MISSERQLKFFIWMIALSPILQIYGFPSISWLTFADIGLIVALLTLILKGNFRFCNIFAFVLVVYIIVQAICIVLTNHTNDVLDTVGTAMRLSVVILVTGFTKYTGSYNLESFVRPFRIIAIINSIYGVLQFAFGTFFQKSLSPYIPFLPVLRINLDVQQENWIKYGLSIRARAFFSEPSFFAIFLLLAISMEFFLLEDSLKKWVICFLYILGILVSQSSLGMIGIIIILCIFTIERIKNGRFLLRSFFVFISIALISMILIVKFNFISIFINHTFVNGSILEQSHFSSVSNIFNTHSNFLQIIFGHGLQQETNDYLPGWIRVYYALGIIGLTLYIIFFIDSYKIISPGSRKIVLLFAILCIGSEIIVGCYFMVFFFVARLSSGIGINNYE